MTQKNGENIQNLRQKIESILFVATKPMSLRKLTELLQEKSAVVERAIQELSDFYEENQRGIRLARAGNEVELATAPESARLVQDFLRDEMTGELTKPSLETLTIIAYRGPITKAEIEQIRGVNCGLILRNLMIRGLIDADEDREHLITRYQVSLDFLRYLGITETKKLPDYERLHNADVLERLLHGCAPPQTKEENKEL